MLESPSAKVEKFKTQREILSSVFTEKEVNDYFILKEMHFEKMMKFIGGGDRQQGENFINTVKTFILEIQSEYPNYRDCALFHAIVGSSLDENTPPTFFDFPGKHSIKEFINPTEKK